MTPAVRMVARPQPLATRSFTIFRVFDDGRAIFLGEEASLDAAVERGTLCSIHKERFMVRERDLDGVETLRFYLIRRTGPPVYRGPFGTERCHVHRADLQHTFKPGDML